MASDHLDKRSLLKFGGMNFLGQRRGGDTVRTFSGWRGRKRRHACSGARASRLSKIFDIPHRRLATCRLYSRLNSEGVLVADAITCLAHVEVLVEPVAELPENAGSSEIATGSFPSRL